MSTRKALIVGINYPGTAHSLNGCVNDANLIADMLTNNFGFTDAKNRRMLTDESATAANIRERLNWLVDGAEAGDVLWFSYSGHGSQMINQQYDDADFEPDNKDEVICPVDFDWREKTIRDDELKEIFDRVPNGVNLTVLLDCCNSGSGLDQDNQYQSLGQAERDLQAVDPVKGARFLPMPSDIANRGRGLELTVRPRSVQSRNVNQTGLLISGCQSHQTSADAWIGGRYIGACTYFLEDTLKANDYNMSYLNLVDIMNSRIAGVGFTQRPELDGSADLFDVKFLDPLVVGTGLDEPETAPVTPVETIAVEPEVLDAVKPKKKWAAIGIAVVVAVLAIGYYLTQS